MLKFYLCLYLLFYMIQTFSQSTLISKQGFESSGNNWLLEQLSTPACTQEDDSWNYSESLGEIFPSEGSYFWGIQDLNGNCGSASFEYLELATVNIADFRNVVLSFDVQVRGYDNGDDMKYQLWINGKAQPEVLFIDGGNDLTTELWEKVSIDIPNDASSVKIRVSIKQNGSDTGGLDNFQLRGKPIAYCADLLISEYLEGSSSTSHRNNYIELFNPGEGALDLNAYQLVKYTGSNIDYSSSLQLAGSLASGEVFLVEDNQENLNVAADLSTNSSVMNFNGDDKIALIKDNEILDVVGVIGDSVNFAKDVTLRRKSHIRSGNNDYDASEWDVYGMEDIANLGSHSSYCQGNLPEIEVSANGIPIADGALFSSLVDNTYFGFWPVAKDTLISRQFIIKNTGNEILNIEKIRISGVHASQFSTALLQASSIAPNDSLQFDVLYNPDQAMIHTARVEIINDDPSESTYDFVVQGEGTASGTHPLIISQYYEGNANDKWIEVTNISDQPSPENTYFLGLYWNEDSFNPIGIKPSRKKLVPSIAAGRSLKFCATLNVKAPQYALDGNEIKTSVCGFTGDDIIVLSTSDDESCWANRTDMIGRAGNWGSNLSMVRKYGCNAVSPNTGYDPSEWLIYTYQDTDQALPETNQRIGTHLSGPTTWQTGSWTNGVPDTYRIAFIAHDYFTEINGSIKACSLNILKEASLRVGPDDFLDIEHDLIVNGNLEVSHNGSLIMRDDMGKIENPGSIYIRKTASGLKPFDYTFWSSPVEHAELENVFNDSSKNSFYTFSIQNFEDLDLDGLDDNRNSWVAVSGVMEVGRGYTSMAPDTTPFMDSQEVTFNGTVNNGRIEVPLSIQSNSLPEQHHWNLIGNPYPSPVDAKKLLNHPLNKDLLTGSLYFWTHNTAAVTDGSLGDQSYSSDDYAMYTIGTGGVKASPDGKLPTQYISSCQGFFVEAIKEGKLVFNNAMRSHTANDVFFKRNNTKNKEQENKIWLNLSNENGAFSQLLIGFIDGASIKFDPLYDGQRMNSQNHISFYTKMDKYQLAIQGLPPFQGDEIIELGISNRIKGVTSLQISLDQITGAISKSDIILYDKLLHQSQNLKLAPYHFWLEKPEEVHDRFLLKFSDHIVKQETAPEVSRIIWHLFDSFLSVGTSDQKIIRHLEVFDLNGRKLRDLHVNNKLAEVNWYGFPSRAIYIIRVKLQNSKTLIAKILP